MYCTELLLGAAVVLDEHKSAALANHAKHAFAEVSVIVLLSIQSFKQSQQIV